MQLVLLAKGPAPAAALLGPELHAELLTQVGAPVSSAAAGPAILLPNTGLLTRACAQALSLARAHQSRSPGLLAAHLARPEGVLQAACLKLLAVLACQPWCGMYRELLADADRWVQLCCPCPLLG